MASLRVETTRVLTEAREHGYYCSARRTQHHSDRSRCRTAKPRCRAVAPESDAEWLSTSSGGSRLPPPLSLLDEDLVQASAELQELCRLQLQLLTTALQLSLQAVLSSSIAGSVSESLDEEDLRQQLLLDSTLLRSTVYCRAPASLQTGQLQLQLVADSQGPGDGGSARRSRGRSASAQQAQRFLFLGQDGGGSSLADQERWIVEQPVIVLPDSGGLVLPLASNGFLVGLLVVERCNEEAKAAAAAADQAEEEDEVGEAWRAAQGASASAGAAGGGGMRMPQAPACLLFRTAELQLLKQTAGVLALACAMDLRAALERAGAAYRQRQASALVQEAKKPLSVMRTLGTMLLPRLEPGEPDRDFAQGILEQGTRLQEVVTQLQAALHPAAIFAPAAPPTLQLGPPPVSSRQAAAPRLPGWQAAEPLRPALPSSTIGSDYQWGSGSGGASTSVQSMDQASEEAAHVEASATGSSDSDISSRSSSSGGDVSSSSGGGSRAKGPPVALPPSGGGYGSRASADLLNVLMPLLASASNLAAVNGVTFAMADHSSNDDASSNSVAAEVVPAQPAKPVPLRYTALPAAEVAVGPGKLKRMLSQLIDGIIACAARGDVVQASVVPQQWLGRPGIAITLCCCYSLAHGGGGGGGPPRPPMQPEFAFLQGTAADAGGWFEVHAEPADVRHLNSSSLAATLWMPTVVRDAGW